MHYDVCISIIIGCSLSVPAGWRSPIYDFIAGRAVCHDGAAKPVHREKCIEEEREREREPSFEHEPIVARLFLRLLNRRGEKKKKKNVYFRSVPSSSSSSSSSSSPLPNGYREKKCFPLLFFFSFLFFLLFVPRPRRYRIFDGRFENRSILEDIFRVLASPPFPFSLFATLPTLSFSRSNPVLKWQVLKILCDRARRTSRAAFGSHSDPPPPLSLSLFSLSLGPPLDRFSNEARSIHRSKKLLPTRVCVGFPRDESDIGELRDGEITIEEREKRGKKFNRLAQTTSSNRDRPRRVEKTLSRRGSFHRRKPRTRRVHGGKKNNLSLRGDPRGVVRSRARVSLLARDFCSRHLTSPFIVPFPSFFPCMPRAQPFQRSPRDARTNRTYMRVNRVHRIEEEEERKRKKKTDRKRRESGDEGQKEGGQAARAPSSSPSFLPSLSFALSTIPRRLSPSSPCP